MFEFVLNINFINVYKSVIDFPASLSNKKRKFSLNKILSSAYHGGSVESRDQSSVHYNHHLKVTTGI